MILVTGAAGYIGSHTVQSILERHLSVVAADDLSVGVRSFIPDEVPFYQLNVGSEVAITDLLLTYSVTDVIHFAGSIDVAASFDEPGEYYRNNTFNTLSLALACKKAGVRSFVFSSTCAVYGDPEHNPVSEAAGTFPQSPYGRSKLFAEQMIEDVFRNSSTKWASLRYFNVGGAHRQRQIGQIRKTGNRSLIKACAEAAVGKNPEILINGTDYNTPDGTCIRDFIHVQDLADIHVEMLRYLRAKGEPGVFNCGYGHGYSVLEVVNLMQEISNKRFDIRYGPRREGDIASIYADVTKVTQRLGWKPKYNSIKLICSSALEWERTLSR